MKTKLLTLAIVMLARQAEAATAEFGVVSLTLFETARLTAFCSEHLGNQDACEVLFEYQNIHGGQLKTAQLTMARGTGQFLDLRGSEAGGGAAVEVIPCIKVLRGAVVVSVQTIGNLLPRTNLLVSWSDKSVPRMGEFDFAAAGVTALDTARLSAFCPSDGTRAPVACDVTFFFHDLRGRVLKPSRVTLQPGTGGSLDLRSSESGSVASRVEIIPCFKVASGAVVASFRLLDAIPGQSSRMAYPAAALLADAGQ